MNTKILPGMQVIQDEMIALRHQIHSKPEIGFEEFLTSDLVAECLTKWGYKVHRGLGGTGVVEQLVNSEAPHVDFHNALNKSLKDLFGMRGGGKGGGAVDWATMMQNNPDAQEEGFGCRS